MREEGQRPDVEIAGNGNVVGDDSSAQVVKADDNSAVYGIAQIGGNVTESVVVTAGRDVNINFITQVTSQELRDQQECLLRLTIATLAEIAPEHRLSKLLPFLSREEITQLAKEVLGQSDADYYILFRDVTPDDDTDAAEHTRQGFSALAMSQPTLAMYHFERAIELEGERADAWLGLSWAQYESNLLKKALTSTVQAERRDPVLLEKNKSVKASILVEYGRAYGVEHLVQEGIQIFEAILAEDETQAMTWYNLGNSYSALGNHNQAVVCFKRSIDLQSSFPGAHVNLGIAYFHLSQHELELSCYDKALRINPDHPQALVCKGTTLSIVYDKHAEAVDLYEQVLANASGFCRVWPRIWYNLGYACTLAGQYKRAYEALVHFRKVVPTFPVDGLLAHVLSALWRQEPENYAAEAAESFTRYIATKPDDHRAHLELGDIFCWLQEYDRALEAYPVPDLNSETNAVLLDHYGHCLSTSGRQEESLPYFARAAEIDPEYRHCYAREFLSLHRYAEALSNLIKVPRDHQDDPGHLCDLGICYANLDEEPCALVAFNQAIDRDEEYGDAWYYLGLICTNRHEYRFALAALAYAGQLDGELASRASQVAEEVRVTQHKFDQTFLKGLGTYLAGNGEGIDEDERVALRLLSYGDGYREQSEFEKASILYRQALDHCGGGAYPWLAAMTKRRLAQIALEGGHFEQAIALYEDAFGLAVAVQDELLIAEIGPEVGNVLSAIGQYSRAIPLFNAALELELRAGRGILIASIQHDIAVTYYQSGDLVRVRKAYYQALASSERYGYDLTRVLSWEGLGHSYRDMGLHLLGLEFYQKALAFYRDHESLVGAGRVLNGMGVAYHWLGDYRAAVSTLSESAETKRESDDNASLPDVYVNLGNIFASLNAYDQARFYYGLAQTQFADTGNAQGFVDATINLGVSLEEEGALEQAIELYQDTLATFAEISQAPTVKLRFYLGRALWRNGQKEEARQTLCVAQESATALGMVNIARNSRQVLISLETEQGQVEDDPSSDDFPSDDGLDATLPHPRAYSVYRTLQALQAGICSSDDFVDEIKLRFTYPNPIIRVQGVTLFRESLPLLEKRRDVWQQFKKLSDDSDAMVRAVFCIPYTICCEEFDEIDEGVVTLLSLTYDEVGDVRAMSLSGLAELYRTMSSEQRQYVEERVSQMTNDDEEIVQVAAQRFRDQHCSEED
jgi:tetratricopeptide (TPR) repeat protein